MWIVGFAYLGRNALGNVGVEPSAQRLEVAVCRGFRIFRDAADPLFMGETRRNQDGPSPACERLVQCERLSQNVGPEAQHHLSLGRAAPGTVGMIASRMYQPFIGPPFHRNIRHADAAARTHPPKPN
jgi:hypothetical protein